MTRLGVSAAILIKRCDRGRVNEILRRRDEATSLFLVIILVTFGFLCVAHLELRLHFACRLSNRLLLVCVCVVAHLVVKCGSELHSQCLTLCFLLRIFLTRQWVL